MCVVTELEATGLEMAGDLHVELYSAVVSCFALLPLWPALKINTYT